MEYIFIFFANKGGGEYPPFCAEWGGGGGGGADHPGGNPGT